MPFLPAGSEARLAATRSRALPRSRCSTKSAATASENAPQSLETASAPGWRTLWLRATCSARCAGSGRCSQSSSWRRRRSSPLASPLLLANRGSSFFRAGSMATSSASSCRSRSTTRSSSVGSTCWRNRLATQALPETTPASAKIQAAMEVRLLGVRKTYGDVVAVDRVDLEIEDGEFFTLLGPSGSGKTTTLRLIAGFERPDEGRVELHGRDVTRVAPYERDVNTVFQDYALFPHMTVADNVGYGLRVQGVRRTARKARVEEALELVRLPDVEIGR